MLSTVPKPERAVLNKRDSYPGQVPEAGRRVRRVTGMGRGVLRPELAAARFQLARRPPSAGLAPFVEYYWILRWDLRGQPPYEQTILPHPNVNLVFEASGAGIFGVDRRLFTRSLSGRGLAFGVRFLAGGFRPFWQAPISQLTDRVVPAARLFGPQAEKTGRRSWRALIPPDRAERMARAGGGAAALGACRSGIRWPSRWPRWWRGSPTIRAAPGRPAGRRVRAVRA